jgi:hypothetical protein
VLHFPLYRLVQALVAGEQCGGQLAVRNFTRRHWRDRDAAHFRGGDCRGEIHQRAAEGNWLAGRQDPGAAGIVAGFTNLSDVGCGLIRGRRH